MTKDVLDMKELFANQEMNTVISNIITITQLLDYVNLNYV